MAKLEKGAPGRKNSIFKSLEMRVQRFYKVACSLEWKRDKVMDKREGES